MPFTARTYSILNFVIFKPLILDKTSGSTTTIRIVAMIAKHTINIFTYENDPKTNLTNSTQSKLLPF